MISDRSISATVVMSTAFWIIGGALVVVGGFIDLWLTGAGLWLSGVGAVLSIRKMFCRQAQREVSAFDLGRQVQQESTLRGV